VARLHNVFGPDGTYNDGKEKAPAALCRKVIQATDTVEVWGPGTQTRSFLYIDDCIEGIHRLMASTHTDPINLGSDRMISINDLVSLISRVSDKPVKIKNIDGPMGVMGRVSDNDLIQQVLGWQPPDNLEQGLKQTYQWIEQQLNAQA
jgi:nucleoside-diphosphate-sugar epimerase